MGGGRERMCRGPLRGRVGRGARALSCTGLAFLGAQCPVPSSGPHHPFLPLHVKLHCRLAGGAHLIYRPAKWPGLLWSQQSSSNKYVSNMIAKKINKPKHVTFFGRRVPPCHSHLRMNVLVTLSSAIAGLPSLSFEGWPWRHPLWKAPSPRPGRG